MSIWDWSSPLTDTSTDVEMLAFSSKCRGEKKQLQLTSLPLIFFFLPLIFIMVVLVPVKLLTVFFIATVLLCLLFYSRVFKKFPSFYPLILITKFLKAEKTWIQIFVHACVFNYLLFLYPCIFMYIYIYKYKVFV